MTPDLLRAIQDRLAYVGHRQEFSEGQRDPEMASYYNGWQDALGWVLTMVEKPE